MSKQQSLSSFFGTSSSKKRKTFDHENNEPPTKKIKTSHTSEIDENIIPNTIITDKKEIKQKEEKTIKPINSIDNISLPKSNKYIENEKKWRLTLPKYIEETDNIKSLSEFTQQQSTQQASRYLKTKYNPLKDIIWKTGEPVPYLALSRVMNAIEKTSKRLEIIELYSQFLRSVIATTPSDLLKIIYLSTNQVAPSYKGIELGIGESLLMKAIAESTQNTTKAIKNLYHKKGDLGTVAKECRTAQRTMFQPKALTVQKVFDSFYEIALMKGHSSSSRKVDKIKGLLVSCKEYEATYIIRSLEGKLRIGLAAQSVLIAIAHTFVLTPPCPINTNDDSFILTLDSSKKKTETELQSHLLRAESIVKQVFYQLPSFDIIIPQLLAGNLLTLEIVCPLTPGIPLKPMLAHPTKGISEVLQRFENMTFTCEYKYDGERAQIHYLEDGSISIYSRNAENNTQKFPDIIELMPTVIKKSTKSFVIDCEAVAFDVETNKILPFQILSTRGKKDVQKEDIKVQVCLFVFDILYLNNKSYLKESLFERRNALFNSFNEIEGKFAFATHAEMDNPEDIEVFLNKSIEDLCEGLMVKTLHKDASYEPSKRSHNWLKLKKDYLNDMGDSLDLVIIGGYKGRGKRTGLYGGFLLACYDVDNDEYQSICKIGTGFSDVNLVEFSKYFQTKELNDSPSYYRIPERDLPDVWFPPERVIEVKAADLSISPNHKAALGLVDNSKGISLRFPRFLGIRDDKKPEDATDSSQIATMYRAQANKQSNTITGETDDW